MGNKQAKQKKFVVDQHAMNGDYAGMGYNPDMNDIDIPAHLAADALLQLDEKIQTPANVTVSSRSQLVPYNLRLGPSLWQMRSHEQLTDAVFIVGPNATPVFAHRVRA
jgi:hypothetical protein